MNNKIFIAVFIIVVASGVYIFRDSLMWFFYAKPQTEQTNITQNGNNAANTDNSANNPNASGGGVSNPPSGNDQGASVGSINSNNPASSPNNIPDNAANGGTAASPAKPDIAVPAPEAKPISSSKIIADVPFTSQAPFGNWSDPKEQHGCEEASLTMAAYWIKGQILTPDLALKEIIALSDFELQKYGNYYDTSIADTLKVFEDYYGYKNAFTKYDITLDDIKAEIDKGNLVITPMNGIKLGNPHYTPPGPELHQIVIIGYDDKNRQFITNDSGTHYGASYRYGYDTFMNAIRDYNTGQDLPVTTDVKAMLVIGKKQV